MYPDSNYFIRLLFKAYHDSVILLWNVSHQNLLPIYFTPQDMIQPFHKTGRIVYLAERKSYRMAHHVVKGGEVLNKREYYIYSLIARKYGWPYIKEVYDNLPDQ